jgi:hypothetical protein
MCNGHVLLVILLGGVVNTTVNFYIQYNAGNFFTS